MGHQSQRDRIYQRSCRQHPRGKMQVLNGKAFVVFGNWRVIDDFAMSGFQECYIQDGSQKDEGEREGI